MHVMLGLRDWGDREMRTAGNEFQRKEAQRPSVAGLSVDDSSPRTQELKQEVTGTLRGESSILPSLGGKDFKERAPWRQKVGGRNGHRQHCDPGRGEEPERGQSLLKQQVPPPSPLSALPLHILPHLCLRQCFLICTLIIS